MALNLAARSATQIEKSLNCSLHFATIKSFFIKLAFHGVRHDFQTFQQESEIKT